ncbi:MAG: hypothetical protein WCX83_00205 [Candidatus Cloacimonas sp.]
MLRYSELTDNQKSIICNGCGGKGVFIKPPDFIFKASCNQHDFYYWLGKDENDRKKADKEFYRFMRIDISEVELIKKPYYHTWALAYYLSVRAFGRKFFNYSDKYKTVEEI